jgi:hypothetical protein
MDPKKTALDLFEKVFIFLKGDNCCLKLRKESFYTFLKSEVFVRSEATVRCVAP